MATGSGEPNEEEAEVTAATAACLDTAHPLPRLPESQLARSTAARGSLEHELGGLRGLLLVDDACCKLVCTEAAEQPGELPAAKEQVPRVILRMKYPLVDPAGGGDSGGELVTASSAPLRELALQLADTRKDLNRCRIEKSKERREFEAQVRACKELAKTNHRELHRRIQRASDAASKLQHMFKEERRRAASLRRDSYGQSLEVKRLRVALDEARCSGAKHQAEAAAAASQLARQGWKLDKVTARLHDEKSAYRVRAADVRQAKVHAKENVGLHEVAKKSQCALEAAHDAAGAVRRENVALKAKLAQAEEALAAEQQRKEEAHRAAQQAVLEMEAEKEKSTSLGEERDTLMGEFIALRQHADKLATAAASALTAPRYKDVKCKDISYRTKCRAHYEDRQYLTRIFSERVWRGDDVAAVLHDTGLLQEVFASSQVCD